MMNKFRTGLTGLFLICVAPTSLGSWSDQSMASNGAAKMAAYEATMGEVYGLTEGWVREFYEKPDWYIEKSFGVSDCSANLNCADIVNSILSKKINDWDKSEDKGKILVFLTYIIGSAIIQENNNLKWTVLCERGFLSEISIGDGTKIMRIFTEIANFDQPDFILKETGFDILTWKKLLKFHEENDVAGNKPTPGWHINIITK